MKLPPPKRWAVSASFTNGLFPRHLLRTHLIFAGERAIADEAHRPRQHTPHTAGRIPAHAAGQLCSFLQVPCPWPFWDLCCCLSDPLRQQPSLLHQKLWESPWPHKNWPSPTNVPLQSTGGFCHQAQVEEARQK